MAFVSNVLLKFVEAVEVTLQILREELPQDCMAPWVRRC